MKKILTLIIVSLLIVFSLGMSFADSSIIKNDPEVKVVTVKKSKKIISSKKIDSNYQKRSQFHEKTIEYIGRRSTHEELYVSGVQAGTVDINVVYKFEKTWLVNEHGNKLKLISVSPDEIIEGNIEYDLIPPFQIDIVIYDEGIGGTTARLAGTITSTSGGAKSFNVELEL